MQQAFALAERLQALVAARGAVFFHTAAAALAVMLVKVVAEVLVVALEVMGLVAALVVGQQVVAQVLEQAALEAA